MYNRTDQYKIEDDDSTFFNPKFSQVKKNKDISEWIISVGRHEGVIPSDRWMWYVFPQIYGLGYSDTSQYYSIHSLEEAKAFLADPYLGSNLISICEALLRLESNDAAEIFGSPDNMKLQSCMTLFSCADHGNPVFDKVLEKYFDGQPDHRTLSILGKESTE